jgi:surface polysaccharide O-acyltransferase-like enzyme
MTPRHCFLDWLRIGAFAVLVLFHVGMYYVRWDWHVKAPELLPALEPWMRLSNPWRMSLLFLLSGAATAWMLQGGRNGLLRERSRRLLLPLLLGVVLIVPPQSYFEVVQKFRFEGDYADFLRLYFSAYAGFCRDGRCLVLPTWNHLWFLPYLWCYTVLLVLLHRTLPTHWKETMASRFGRLPAWQLWLGPLLWLALLRLTLGVRYPSTYALVDDFFNHASYFSCFVLGVGLACNLHLFVRLGPLRWWAAGASLLCWAALSVSVDPMPGLALSPQGLRTLQGAAHASLQWSAIVAALGFAHRHLNRDHPWRAPLTEAVFPVYLVHQTWIILLAMALRPWPLAPGWEAALLVSGTLLLSLGTWRLVRRSGALRPWWGLPRRSTAAR